MIARCFALLLAALLAGCSGTKVEYEEVEVGYRGAARQDPFLAANRLLKENGYTTNTSRRLRDCLKETGTLITPLQSFNNHGETDDVLAWTQRGGHLVLILAGGESWRDDWKTFDLKTLWEYLKKREVAEQARLLRALEIKSVSERDEKETAVKVGNRRMSCSLTGRITFEHPPTRPDGNAGEKEEPSFISYRLGGGRVTLLAHAHPWRNRYIGDSDHAEMFSAVIGMGRSDIVWFLNGVRISFWTMLWERAWLAMIALALLLAVWLARYLRRLGPVGLLKSASARNFSDHLLLTGAFLWRHRQADALVAPVQNAIHTAARRRGWSVMDDEFFAHIAATSGLKAERARAILASGAPHEPHAFRLLMQDLRKMLDALGG